MLELLRSCNAACWPKAANGPTTPDADEVLDQRRARYSSSPTFLQRGRRRGQLFRVGAGSAAVLLGRGGGDDEAPPRARPRLDAGDAPRRARQGLHRTAAMAIGVEKVRSAKNTRGLFP